MATVDEAVEEVRRTLETLPGQRLLILGAYSDAYPLAEAKHGITRGIVEELVRIKERFTIVTKGMFVLRDADLLLKARDRCNVQVSVSCTEDDVLRIIEPHAPSGTARFELIRNLNELGIAVDVNALPWIPDVSDTEAIIQRVPKNVPITFSPLAFGRDRDSRWLLGKRYNRQEVWERYMLEYHRFAHHTNTSWVRPCLPPHENHPMYRLPVLQAASEPCDELNEISRHMAARYMQCELAEHGGMA